MGAKLQQLIQEGKLNGRRFHEDTVAALQMTKALNLVYIFIGVFIGLAVLAALIQPFFIFLNNFVDNLTFDFGTSANDTLVESILAILVILVLLGGVIWVVAYAIRMFKGSKGG
jgi:hypothetical protein